MIFQHSYQLVLAGCKSQTRRIIRSERPPCKVGATVAVQPGRGKKSVGRIMVTALSRELLGSITEADARAEGFASRAEFIETWRRMHGQFEDHTEIWVIKFRLAE
jgi:hypothetical protein